MTIFMLWSIGFFASWGFPGFVRANDIQSINTRQIQNTTAINDLNRRSLEYSMLTALRVQCTAKDKRFATRRLGELKYDFRVMTGFDWQQPLCAEVVAEESPPG